MSDEKGEPIPTNAEPGPDSPLTARLLSRATDSLGLIDVRGAEQHYARIMDWLAGRTPLLERLRTRYGLTEGEGLTGLAFAEPRGWDGAHFGDEGVNLSAAPAAFNAPAAEQIFTHVAHVPDDPDDEPTEVKRIARRGVPTFSSTSSETDPAAVASHKPVEVVRHEPGELFRPALELTVTNQEQARDLQSPAPVRETPAAQMSATHPASLPSIEERAATPSTEPERTLARTGSTSTSTVKSPPTHPTETNDTADVNNSTDVQEPRRDAKPFVPRVTESSRPDALTLPNTSRTTSTFVADEAKELPLDRGGAAEGVKGRASTGKATRLPVAGETRAASVSAEMPHPLAHAREIQAADSGRASTSPHAPLPLAQSHAAVERAEAPRRQNDNAPAVTRASSSSGVVETYTPARARTHARADELNVQRLTEQVSRHLARRLLVERERRGWGRK